MWLANRIIYYQSTKAEGHKHLGSYPKYWDTEKNLNIIPNLKKLTVQKEGRHCTSYIPCDEAHNRAEQMRKSPDLAYALWILIWEMGRRKNYNNVLIEYL